MEQWEQTKGRAAVRARERQREAVTLAAERFLAMWNEEFQRAVGRPYVIAIEEEMDELEFFVRQLVSDSDWHDCQQRIKAYFRYLPKMPQMVRAAALYQTTVAPTIMMFLRDYNHIPAIVRGSVGNYRVVGGEWERQP